VREPEWKTEIREAKRNERWSLRGPNRPVKVTPLERVKLQYVSGYITLAGSLAGMTPSLMERALGLPLGYLSQGARIYSLRRLPQPSEYEYELSAKYPGGLAFNFLSDPRYLPGNEKIHQWKIYPGINIPVDPASELMLLPNQRFPYV
jgi:hypothetical protein